jgi:sulfatase maturation enzyme AslB (radical SAM superfamily)
MGHPYKDTISLQEAIQLSEGPLAFNLMIKPAGSLCSRYMQFMPVVEHVRQSVIVDPYEKDAEIAPWSVSSQGFGRFMCEIFD